MRSSSWKILALLPVALFASSAFGTTVNPPLAPAYDISISWTFQTQNGTTIGGISGPVDPNFWAPLFNNNAITFTNPSGPGTAKVIAVENVYGEEVDSVYAAAPSVAASNPDVPNGTLVDAVLQFYAKVIGPPTRMPVPLSWEGRYTLSGAAGGLYGPDNQVTANVSDIIFTKNCGVVCSSGGFSGSTDVRSGQLLSIKLGVGAYSQNGGPTGVALIDPYFYFSPAEVAAGYSLAFSEDIVNGPPGSVPGSAVPEPASLMLFGTGVIAAGIMRRIRQTRRFRSRC